MHDYASILRPAPGVQVIPDIAIQPGVRMAEGRLSPLIWGAQSQSYLVEMPPGAYLEEHPHAFEAIIFTVYGRFVLCANGQRHLLPVGSLMSFGADVATGYEVPFAEPAGVLVFRAESPAEDQVSFMDRLQEAHPPDMRDLPFEHPARAFARRINPSFV